MGCACQNDKETRLLYACSGAANTGMLADQVARKLARDGEGSMTCLAAVGADLSGFLTSARSVDKNVVIDGCPVACGKKIFEAKHLPYMHYILTEFGVEKGKTVITGEIIDRVSDEISLRIR